MNAIAGIKSELKTRREEREHAAELLDLSHKEYSMSKYVFERDQKRVEFLNERIEALAKALRDLGGSDE